MVRWHQGHCYAHGRYACATCRRQEVREEREVYDYGLFEWRSDGIYTRGTALKIYKSRAVAERAADKLRGENVVVRPVRKVGAHSDFE